MKRKENDGSWLYRVVYIKGLTFGVSRSLEMGTKIDGAKYGLGNGKEHDCLAFRVRAGKFSNFAGYDGESNGS